ncbi:hypothetical protein [Rhizobium sp. BK399]|uniref:hypothetical protein n=1 Tax=Rhizobium sp. BK399 TaxID=2587063 RepID=UPI0017D0D84C|nr:hypothetical protein [Rhizobium sp. BK399]MBB3543771.1 hypothetical protein [Rhizobium sp. BK399]
MKTILPVAAVTMALSAGATLAQRKEVRRRRPADAPIETGNWPMAIEHSSVDEEESPLQTVRIIGQTASSAA